MAIEAVTVCVDYSDFLQETIKYNYPLLDRWIIVTTPEDEATREVCRKYNLTALTTNEFTSLSPTDQFNKARGINLGLEHCAKTDWLLHLDSDIILPFSFRQAINQANLSRRKIYGCDRIMIRSWESWQTFKNSGYLQQDYHSRTNFPPKEYSLGARWSSPHYGYCPIGFFQLWHSSIDLWHGISTRRYPEVHNDAARADVQHSLQWDRQDRELIPELIAIHLESEPARLGANWQGRTTKLFGPNPSNKEVKVPMPDPFHPFPPRPPHPYPHLDITNGKD